MTGEIAVEVSADPKATIVFVADADAFGDLQHRWPGMRFPQQTKTIVVLRDVPPEDVWLPGERKPDSILHISEDDQTAATLLEAITGQCSTERIIFLSPNASAMPGAELFISEDWNAFDAVCHTTPDAVEEPRITGNVFVPAHFSGFARTSFLRELAMNNREIFESDLAMFMHISLAASGAHCGTVDLRNHGWHMPHTFRYVRNSLHPAGAIRGGAFWNVKNAQNHPVTTP